MKTAALIFFVALAVIPLSAQQLPEVRQRVFTIGGEEMGGAGINGLAVGWSLSRAHRGVTIAARLSNGGGYAGGTAYLMHKIGPHASSIDEIAKKDFELPDDFNGMYMLFTELDLSGGEYWLVFETPRSGPFSYANWIASIPFTCSTSKGTRYLGTTSYTYPNEISTYMPASIFRKVQKGYGYQIEVTGVPVPLLHDEEPSRIGIR